MITVVNAQFFGGDKKLNKLVDQPFYDGVEYKLFTNRPEIVKNTNWEAIELEVKDPRLSAREIKTNIHKFFPKSEYWLWLDANMKLTVDPNIFISQYLNVHDICLMPHPERTHWFEEASFLLNRDQSLKEPLQKAVDKYSKEGYPSTTLYETGVLLRRNTDRVNKFNSIWWQEIQETCIRDQISFPYCAWKAGLAVNTFPGTNSVNQLRYQLKNYLPQWEEVIRDWN